MRTLFLASSVVLVPFVAVLLEFVRLPHTAVKCEDEIVPEVVPAAARVLNIPSGNLQLQAWLLRPAVAKPPLVIMFHGFGAPKHFGLQTIGAEFVEWGYAALLVDYRNMGGSQGIRRKWVNAREQVDDVKAAVRWAVAELGTEVDTDRVVLWGTSLGGGNVIVAARELEQEEQPRLLTGLIAQTPMVLSSWRLPTNIDVMMKLAPSPLKHLWLLAAVLADMLTGRCKVQFIDAPADLGTEKMGWVVSPGSFTAFSLVPDVPTDDDVLRNQFCYDAATLPYAFFTINRYEALQGLETQTLLTCASNDQITDQCDAFRTSLSSHKYVTLFEQESEHFSIYPVMNQTLMKRLDPFMTSPLTTFVKSGYREIMDREHVFLQSLFA